MERGLRSRRCPRLIHRNPLLAERARLIAQSERDQENAMLDIIVLALGLGFFVAAIGYTYTCERL